jgi:F-type H+-transporting ATPase subunit b
MLHWTLTLAAETAEAAEKGGLFDFDATLPIIAIQFMLFVAVLNALFYKPVSAAIDGRADFLRTSLAEARERTEKADQLARQYQEEIAKARVQAQQAMAEAEASAAKVRAETLAAAQAEAQVKMNEAQAVVEAEKAQALQVLEQRVEGLSQQIIAKLLSVAA